VAKPQSSGQPDPDSLDQVHAYQKLVLEYEALDEEIDGLLAQHNGSTEKMSSEDYERYRGLARQRDHVYNQMKAIEVQILLDDELDNNG
jgi:hypothetical protein